MRIELKFRLIHERMLAPEASNNRRRLRRWARLRGGVEAEFSSPFFRSFDYRRNSTVCNNGCNWSSTDSPL
jgi:hypothetical protein